MTNVVSQTIESLNLIRFTLIYGPQVKEPSSGSTKILVIMLARLPMSAFLNKLFELFTTCIFQSSVLEFNMIREEAVHMVDSVPFKSLKYRKKQPSVNKLLAHLCSVFFEDRPQSLELIIAGFHQFL